MRYPLGEFDRNAVGRRVHDHVREPVADDVGAVSVGVLSLPIEIGMVLTTSPLTPDRQRLGVVVGGRDDLVADGEVRVDVVLAEQAVAEIHAVGVDRDVDGRARLPEMLWAPTHFAVVQPVERALDRRVGGHLDRLLGGRAVRDVLVELDGDRLADADDLAVVGHDVRHGQVVAASASGRSSDRLVTPPSPATARSACSSCCSRAARWWPSAGRRG